MKQNLSVDEIIDKVGTALNVTTETMKSRTRKREIVDCRCIAINLIRTNHKISLKKLGLLFSGLDHSTVIYQEERYLDLGTTDKVFKDKINRVNIYLMQN